MTFSPDGRRILSGSGWSPGPRHAGFDYCVRLRDVATGEVLGCIAGHTAPVVTVAFSPSGRAALSAGYDNTIRLPQLPKPDGPASISEPSAAVPASKGSNTPGAGQPSE